MSIKAFLADDHAVVRDGLGLLLDERPDIDVIGQAADGRDAVRQVLDLEPDVVILDIHMPELNGIEALCQIRAARPSVQVVILSMYSTSEHIFRALQAGARGYLLKESAGVEVVEAVRAVHAGHLYLSQKILERVIEDYVRLREDRAPPSLLSRLSPREKEVMLLVVEGKSSTEIAAELCLSPKTVETYRSRLMHKLGLQDLPALVKFAIQNGLTQLE